MGEGLFPGNTFPDVTFSGCGNLEFCTRTYSARLLLHRPNAPDSGPKTGWQVVPGTVTWSSSTSTWQNFELFDAKPLKSRPLWCALFVSRSSSSSSSQQYQSAFPTELTQLLSSTNGGYPTRLVDTTSWPPLSPYTLTGY